MQTGSTVALPEGPARHIQVLRMQPGQPLRVFDGRGQEWLARIEEMGRKHVTVRVCEVMPVDVELPVAVTLAVGMPANDRMDSLIEKATELGVSVIQPLMCERSVLRLDGERALKKVAHWQAVAASACEQSGRAVLPQVAPVQSLGTWLRGSANSEATHATVGQRAILSTAQGLSLLEWLKGWPVEQAGQAALRACTFLSGPEGGFSEAEEQLALQLGWQAVSLGPRILRADTAPLAAISVIGARFPA